MPLKIDQDPPYDFNLLRALEVLLAVAEYGQMTRAATALGITQSAVSQHLSNLESGICLRHYFN